MKKVIIGIVIGLTVSSICMASEKIISNPLCMINTVGNNNGIIYTTKITTSEGTYRIFTYDSIQNGAGITAVKIK